MDAPRTSHATKRDARQAAADYGIDVSLIEINLRKTPIERIRAHQRSLSMGMALREAVRRKHHG